MTFSKFEKYAAGKIKNHVSEVDAEALWNDILPHVQKDKRRWGGLIWFAFIGLVVSIAAFYTFAKNENSDPESEIATLSLTESANEKNNVNSIDDQLLKPSASTTNTENTTRQNIQTSNKNNANTRRSDKISNNNRPYLDTAPDHFQIEKSAIPENSPIDESNEIQIISGETISEASFDAENTNSVDEKEAIKFKINEAVPTDFAHADITTGENNPVTPAEPQTDEPIAQITEANGAEEEDYKTKNKVFRIKYGFGLYGGLSSSFASLKARDEMDFDYLQLRLETEEQLETIQLGLEALVQNEIGVYFKTGLQYSRIARKFSLNSSVVTVDSVHGIQRIYVNNTTNDTIYIYGPVPVITTRTYNKVTYNYFHLMDIPLVMGYNYRNENWSFGVEAGALINISTKRKGEIMENESDIYDIKEDRLGWFKDNIGVGFTASVMAAYHLNDNLQIYLAPTARLESVFNTDVNPIEQKHGALGINIGARYFIGY